MLRGLVALVDGYRHALATLGQPPAAAEITEWWTCTRCGRDVPWSARAEHIRGHQ